MVNLIFYKINMKRILIILTLCFGFTMANAQIATENRKAFDNVYVGVEIGATTPLNFSSVFPVAPVAGVKIGKEFTPIFGIEAEGLAMFGENFNRYGYESSTPTWYMGPFNIHQNGSVNTFIKATNVGLNGTINWSNLLWGYKGTPRVFEIKSNTGLGWLHYFGDYTPDYPIGGIKVAGEQNVLTAKTAIDLVFNLGHKKAHSLVLSPGIYWALNETGSVKFDENYAQFGVTLGYTYHFKTSNGTHHFKIYDVGAMMSEIDRLNEELAKKPTKVVKYVEVVKTDTLNNAILVPTTWVVQFAQNSAVLSNEAKSILDGIYGNVNIVASASPEGTKDYNQKLSEKRAAVVAEYLIRRGIKVNSSEGIGCVDENSNRIAIITSY
jgi:hypothetical protein